MKEPHVYSFGAFIITTVAIGLQNQFEILPVSLLTGPSGVFGCTPALIPGTGNAGSFAQPADIQEIVVLLCGPMDQ